MPPNARVVEDKALSQAVKSASSSKYSWQEVAKHNTAESAWVIVNRKVYDVTEFVERHPGGKDMILLAAGRECTELFTMYHALSTRSQAVLDKYVIGEVVGESEFPSFSPDSNGFYKTMSSRVAEHFRKTGQDPKSPLAGLLRMAVVFPVTICLFLIMHGSLLPWVPLWAKVVAAIAFGVGEMLPLMHIVHDASHAAFGASEGWWRATATLIMEFWAGGCMMSWHHQHVVGHHVYTNVFEADPDLPVSEQGDVRRLVSRQLKAALYKYQHIYLPILYGVIVLKNRIQDIQMAFFSKMNGPIRVNLYRNPWQVVVLHKLVWAGWRFALPLLVLKQSVGEFAAVFLAAEIMAGYYLAYNFQVSHISTDVSWPNGDTAGVDRSEVAFKQSWAELQVRTSVGYGHDSFITTFLTAALNYQVEHHLFPGVSQYHYPAIAPIVKQTCKEFGVPYRTESGFWTAWAQHVKYLKQMGAEGKAGHLD